MAAERTKAWSTVALGGLLLSAGAGSVMGALAAIRPGPALVVLGVWLLLFVRRPGVVIVSIALFALSAGRARAEMVAYSQRAQDSIAELEGPRRCALSVQITVSPVMRASFQEGEGLDLSATGEVLAGDCEARPLTPGTLIRVSGPRRLLGGGGLARGDQVEFIAQLAPVRAFHNAGLPTPLPRLAHQGVTLSGRFLAFTLLARASHFSSWIDRARWHVRSRILATYSPKAVPLARALVLGENDLPSEESQAFRQSGLLHLLAVSGTHLVIAVLALVKMSSAILVRVSLLARRFDVQRIPAAMGASLSLVYADFSGQSGSAVRAAIMLVLLLGARALGRRMSGLGALGGSLVLGVLYQPLLGTDISFLLSSLATAGLLTLGQPLAQLLARGPWERPPLRLLVDGVSATLSATLFCAPLLSCLDGDMSAISVFANLVAGPLGELLALPACLLHTLAAPLPGVEKGLSVVGSWALLLVRRVALESADAGFAQFSVGLPTAWTHCRLSCFCLLVVSLADVCRTCRLGSAAFASCALSLGLLGGIAPVLATSAPMRGTLGVTMLDVGQGDAHLLDFPDGRLGLVDGGGFAMGVPDTAERVLLPMLRARARQEVDLMVASHAHPDHINGLLGVAARVRVDELWHPELPVRTPSLRELVRRVRARGGRVLGPRELCAGLQVPQPRFFGGARLDVLVPCAFLETTTPTESSQVTPAPAGPLPVAALGAEEPWGLNDASLVLRLSMGRRTFLMTGDVERRGEGRLLEQFPGALEVDVLKVPHHGSDTSSTDEFLEATQPRLALIASGVRNGFSHPRASVLARLQVRGIAVLRTDLLGSVSLLTEGSAVSVRTARPLR